MPRRCTICTHTDRDTINQMLVGGNTFRTIAHHFACSEDALKRHKRDHLPVALVSARNAQEAVNADGLLDQVRSLQSRAMSILGKAEAAGDLRTALGAIRETRGNLELLAKLLGELQDGQTVNVLVMPEWVTIRTTVLLALEPYPDAQQAEVRGLNRHAG